MANLLNFIPRMSIICYDFNGTGVTMLEDTGTLIVNAFSDYVLGVVMLQSVKYKTTQPLANASITILSRNRTCASTQSNANGEYLIPLSPSTLMVQCAKTDLTIWIQATCNLGGADHVLVEGVDDFINMSGKRLAQEADPLTFSRLIWYHPIYLDDTAITCMNCSQSSDVPAKRLGPNLPTNSQKRLYHISFGLYALLLLFLLRRAFGHSHSCKMHGRCQNEHSVETIEPGSIQIEYNNRKCTRRALRKHRVLRPPKASRTHYIEARLCYKQCVTTTLTDEML